MQPPLSIEGYTDQLSVSPGSTLTFYASSNAPTYTVEISRVGSARQIVWSRNGLSGNKYPVPADTSTHGYRWPQAFELTIPRNWLSDYYSAILRTEHDGVQTTGEISFVVRSEHPGRAATFLLQLTTNTDYAYNTWVWEVALRMRKNLCEKCGERPCKCVKKVKIELGKGKTHQIPFHCSSQTSHTIIPNYLFMNHQCYSTFSNPESPPSTTILHKDGLNPSPCREVTERRSAISGKHVGSRRRWCLKPGRDRIGHGYSLSDTLEAFSAGPERTDCELFFQQFRRQCRKPLEL